MSALSHYPACFRCGERPGSVGVWTPELKRNIQSCPSCLSPHERASVAAALNDPRQQELERLLADGMQHSAEAQELRAALAQKESGLHA